MYIYFHDFAVCGDPHVGSPDTDTGSYDGIHIVFFFEPVRVFPHDTDENICREDLAVVGVAAQLRVGTCSCQFRKLSGLVLQDDNGLVLVQIR